MKKSGLCVDPLMPVIIRLFLNLTSCDVFCSLAATKSCAMIVLNLYPISSEI